MLCSAESDKCKTRLTRIDERKVHDQESNCIWQQAKRSSQQRPEVQALKASESGEDQQQQFESIVNRERTPNRDKNRGDIIVSREESGRVVQVRERDLEAHGGGSARSRSRANVNVVVAAQPLSRMTVYSGGSSSIT